MTCEQWKAVVGWEDFYQVSDRGRVRSLPRVVIRSNGVRYTVRGCVLAPRLDSSGHFTIVLCDCGRRVDRQIHRLVLEAFVGPCPAGLEGCHNDGVHTHLWLSNLRWDTHAANMADTVKHGVRVTVPVRRSDGVVFKSCKSAAKAVGVHRSSVSRSIHLGQRCAGYRWEFINA